MKLYLIAAATVFTALTANAAIAAECATEPQEQWMSQEEVQAKATEMGYDVQKTKIEDGCYEFYALKDGKKFEAFFNPVTAEFVREKADD